MDSDQTGKIIAACTGKDVYIDTFRDRSGIGCLSISIPGDHFIVTNLNHVLTLELLGKIQASAHRQVIFEFRKLEDLGIHPQIGSSVIYDLKILFGGDEKTLFQLAKQFLSPEDVSSLQLAEQNVDAHAMACKTAGVNTDDHPLFSLFPSNLLRKILRLRGTIGLKLWERKLADPDLIIDYAERVFPLAMACYEVERVGVKIDQVYVDAQLKFEHPVHVSKFFRSAKELSKENGYAYTRFNPAGGKTGRFKVASGFNCMSIPHGAARKAIVSRFQEGGRIYTFDYNAIDYRCIVASLDDRSFTSLYDGIQDFHTRTASFLFGDSVNEVRRDIVKKLTYISVYGGSLETIAEKTGLSREKAQAALSRLQEKMAPISSFRERLYRESVERGYILLPHGRRIPITIEDHAGKVVGLYAQGFSSYVFEEAFKAVVRHTRNLRRSRVLFTVHDELVMDVHPSEFGRVDEIRHEMENAVQGYGDIFKVKVDSGRDYGEATDG